MIAPLISLLASIGVPERVRKALAWALVVLAVILALWTAKTLYDRSVVREYEDVKQIGATVEREKTQAATIKNIERANNAAEAIRRDPAARDAECLRYAKNPADC